MISENCSNELFFKVEIDDLALRKFMTFTNKQTLGAVAGENLSPPSVNKRCFSGK